MWYWFSGGVEKCQLAHCSNQGLRCHILSALRHDASMNITLCFAGKCCDFCAGD